MKSEIRKLRLKLTGWRDLTGILLFVAAANLTAVMLIPAVFLSSMPFGVAPAAIQEMTPNVMRGQASAVYLFVVNLIGLGLGPTSVALITDYVFHDPAAVRWSLIIESGVCLTIAGILFYASLRPYRESLEYLKRWSAENERAAA